MTYITEYFEFESYHVHSDKKSIDFRYKIDELILTEKIILPVGITLPFQDVLLNKILQDLHLILGITYYKIYCPKKIVIPYHLSKDQADFWNTVYTKGLGEFFYKNQIDFRDLINFPFDEQTKILSVDLKRKDRALIGIGGGKDSIVAVELLKKQSKEITGFILDTQVEHPQLQIEVAKTMAINYMIVNRQIDPQFFKLEKSAYKGHIPISAIYAFISLLLAYVYNYSSITTANEKSSNFGNVKYLESEINHQWSKSEEFEKLFQNYVSQNITQNISYISILRTYTEMEIAKMFADLKTYFPVFSSCNRNFRINGNQNQKRWCGECAKCCFVFIILATNLPKDEVVKIFGKNLLADSKLIPMYLDLIGKGKIKPFDCVGTFEESTEALKSIRSKGEFDNDVVMKEIIKQI